MKTFEDLKQFYQQDLIGELQEVDEIRKKNLKFSYTLITIFIIILAIPMAFSYEKALNDPEPFIAMFGVFGAIFFITCLVIIKFKIKKSKYKLIFKDKIIRSIIEFISDDLTYYPKRKVKREDFDKSRLFLQRINIYGGDDLVEGEIDKTVFHFSEIRAFYKFSSNNGKNNKKTTRFKGLFFVADFNKDFEGSTVLMPRQFRGIFSFIKKLRGVGRREKYVELQDPKFSEYFTCYSDDDIKARYILSPALMQRINQFKEKYPKNRLHISFIDGQIFIAISYEKRLFEPSLTSSIVCFDTIQEYFDDIRFAVDIVEELNLNTRIWSKA